MGRRTDPIASVEAERQRCALLLQAVIDSLETPTTMSLVVTAEQFIAGPECTALVVAERDRCLCIVDAALARDFTTNPASWALAAILSGEVVPQPFTKR